MFEIKINNKAVQVSEGETLLTAASREGVAIPTMCWIKEFKPSTSCMVCLVQDLNNGRMLTACSSLVQVGMNIDTENDDVMDMRKSALDLLLSEHYGDCEAPCQRSCPAEMDIPLMNRLIASNQMTEALRIVKETIALPGILGYICPAPCEKACRRKDVDAPIAICQLKRYVAEEDLEHHRLSISKEKTYSQKVAIIGAGPAGLAAAYYLGLKGFTCTVYDQCAAPGGKMRTEISEDKLPKEVLDAEIAVIRSLNVEFTLNTTVTKAIIQEDLSRNFDFIVLTVGAEEHIITEDFETTDLSANKDLTIYRSGKAIILAPRQIPSKSKLAVRAAALGRKTGSWIVEYLEQGCITTPGRIFNSNYKRITEDERFEFLKESLNHHGKETTPRWLDGFSVEQAIREAQRCLHCDCRKKDQCVLRDLSTEYKASQRVYTLDKHPRVSKNTAHGAIVLETLKCIKCGICIQTAEQAGDLTGFAYKGRGFDIRLAIPIERGIQQIDDQTALLCAANCPTGAISVKD